jgi:8-oxo-dGTP pyrophosphatase MutT (NUDIX family)
MSTVKQTYQALRLHTQLLQLRLANQVRSDAGFGEEDHPRTAEFKELDHQLDEDKKDQGELMPTNAASLHGEVSPGTQEHGSTSPSTKTDKKTSESQETASIAKVRAAGIMFISNGCVLLLQRGIGGDHPGEWGLPGGKVEPGENFEMAARREAREETGYDYRGPLGLLSQTEGDGVVFVTYIATVPYFEVMLSPESTAFKWVPMGDLLRQLN